MPVEDITMTLGEWYQSVYRNRINGDQLTRIVRPEYQNAPG